MGKLINLVGKTFGRLEVKARYDSRGEVRWYCRCSCGGHAVVLSRTLQNGLTKSCGCLRSETTRRLRTTHGHAKSRSQTPEYRAWRCMLHRCYRKKHRSYKWYGKLGVLVYEPWITSFEKFLKYVGPKPSPKHSLDRYPDPAGDYQPGNVRWATASQQRINRRG